MIKTIILDEAKVNEFIKRLEEVKNTPPTSSVPSNFVGTFAIDSIERLLKCAKIEPQTTKPNQSLPYEVEH